MVHHTAFGLRQPPLGRGQRRARCAAGDRASRHDILMGEGKPMNSNLDAMHTDEAIAKRIAASAHHSYTGDLVLGAVDGAVTTFSIVAGAAGAGLSTTVAIILGVANVLADGFSMAAGNYLKARADQQTVERFRRMEEMHIDQIPNAEREEIRQIFAAKGFEGDVLEAIVQVITTDRKQWVDTMLTEEWGLQLQPPEPWRAGAATMVAFVVAGSVPLLPLFFSRGSTQEAFALSAVMTGITFFAIGLARGKIDGRPLLGGLETLFIGGGAAVVAYFVGAWLDALVG